jgi:hypothetical protein
VGDDLVINQREMDRLLRSDTGEVMQELRRLGKTVERGAKRRTHGRIAAGVKAHEPAVDAQGPHVDIETGAENEHGAPIGLFVEVGTVPHVIESHGDYPLRNRSTGQVFGRKVNHPGTEAQPHLRPALYEDI